MRSTKDQGSRRAALESEDGGSLVSGGWGLAHPNSAHGALLPPPRRAHGPEEERELRAERAAAQSPAQSSSTGDTGRMGPTFPRAAGAERTWHPSALQEPPKDPTQVPPPPSPSPSLACPVRWPATHPCLITYPMAATPLPQCWGCFRNTHQTNSPRELDKICTCRFQPAGQWRGPS